MRVSTFQKSSKTADASPSGLAYCHPTAQTRRHANTTITVPKAKLIAIVAIVGLLIPAGAYAAHTFPDTPDGAFYHEPVEWALANDITTGCNGGTGFCPTDPVTRGENITFAQRYDTNIVQPALAALQADIDAAHELAAQASSAVIDIQARGPYWAVIDVDGTLWSSSHPATSSRDATGFFTVDFDGIEPSPDGIGFACVATAEALFEFAITGTAPEGGGWAVGLRDGFDHDPVDLPFMVVVHC